MRNARWCPRLAVLALALTLAAPATAGQPASCPGQGFDALGCDTARVRAAIDCAPRAVKGFVKRMIRGVDRHVAGARKADGRSERRLAVLLLGRAADRVAALATKLQALRDRGRLTDDCGEPMARHVDVLGADIAALRTTPSTTTTVATATTSTSATSSTLGGQTTTTTTVTSSTAPTCGNGRLDRLEQCDGTNLFGRSCETLGFPGGELRCRPDCLFETSHCKRF